MIRGVAIRPVAIKGVVICKGRVVSRCDVRGRYVRGRAVSGCVFKGRFSSGRVVFVS